MRSRLHSLRTVGESINVSGQYMAAAPDRLAVYDKRAQAATGRLGLTLAARPGRYGRYMQLVEDLRRELRDAHGVTWSARDVDMALYWLGGPQAEADA